MSELKILGIYAMDCGDMSDFEKIIDESYEEFKKLDEEQD